MCKYPCRVEDESQQEDWDHSGCPYVCFSIQSFAGLHGVAGLSRLASNRIQVFRKQQYFRSKMNTNHASNAAGPFEVSGHKKGLSEVLRPGTNPLPRNKFQILSHAKKSVKATIPRH